MSVLIIAEAGVNHNGDIRIAKRLVDEAKRAGADVIKFQTFNASKLATGSARMAEYQKENLGVDESQSEMLARLMLAQEEYIELEDYCRKMRIKFLSTPFDVDSVKFLNNLQDIWKIPSGEITNYPYLVEIAKTGKDIILSTGMSTMDEVDAALTVIKENGAGKVTLLHCTTNYPTPMQEVNLRAMVTMKEHCNCEVGYSDHTQGIEVPVAAVTMGAKVIEKHITLDRTMEGPDHKASLEPHEFTAMVRAIRNIETAMGTGKKEPTQSEVANTLIARKSIVAARDIVKGETLTENNLTTKRPGTGINPMKWCDLIGTRAVRDFIEDEMIEV